MRLTRERGQTALRRAVEMAHERLMGHYSPYYEVAARLYDTHGSQRVVRDEIERIYRVEASEKTVGFWINRGIEERKAALAQQAEESLAGSASR